MAPVIAEFARDRRFAVQNMEVTEVLFDRKGVRYEVAEDVLGAMVSHYAEVIGQEHSKSEPDKAVIASAQVKQTELRTLQDSLDPRDEAQIESVIATYAPLARQVFGK